VAGVRTSLLYRIGGDQFARDHSTAFWVYVKFRNVVPACLPEFEEETLILWKRRNNINERAASTLGSVCMDL
jgi:hypothetical protein